MLRLKAWFMATRPWSFVMTVISATLGLVLAVHEGGHDPLLFPPVLLGLLAFHAATNLVNDLYDVKHSVDRPDAPTAKYRRHPLLTGEFGLAEFMGGITLLYALMLGVAAYLTLIRGWLVAALTAAGFFFSFFYTADPLRFKHRPVGELVVFLTWGPLMVAGTHFVLTGRLSMNAALASIPVGVLVAAVLLANNLRDREYDARTGVKTLAVVLGHRRALTFYKLLIISAYISLTVLAVMGILSMLSFLVFLTLPKALNLIKVFSTRIPEAADPMTAQLALNFGLILLAGELLEAVAPL